MNIEKLQNFEPLFGSWYIDGKVAQGRSSQFYRVRRTENGVTDYLGLKTIRFPRSERDFNRVMESGKYKSAQEYLSVLESRLRVNMEKMMQLRANKNIVRFDNYLIVKELNCFHVIILMELLTPLSDYLSADKINAREIAKMGKDLCFALDGFRRFGIMHREIKPENIFVDGEGAYKLGDFGISEVSETGDKIEEISTYLAPEVLNGFGSDYCSDIYSLGIMMYKFTNNNRMPFTPEFPAPISMADRQRAFERRMSGESLVKPVNADLAFAKIIFKAAAYKPEERYASPKQLENDITAYLSGELTGQSDSDATKVIPQAKIYQKAGYEDANFGKKEPQVSVAALNRDQIEFDEAFEDDEEDENDGSKKKIYALVIAIIIVLAIIAVVLFYASSGGKKPEISETTTQQTTTQVETTLPTTTEPTTTEPTTTETTTEATTAETTTEPTTESTTAETTTEPSTTEETTTEAQPNVNASGEVVLFSPSSHKNGDETSDGKVYTEVSGAKAVKEIKSGQLVKVIVNIDSLGASPEKKGTAYICQVSNGSVLLKEPVDFNCMYDEDDKKSGLGIVSDIDSEIYFDEESDFYIVFEQGAVETEEAVNLPFQIKL